MRDDEIIIAVQNWVEIVVVGLNLCPFAKRELTKQRVRFSVSAAQTKVQLLMALEAELELLNRDLSIATTLLIHPQVLQHFPHYNQFLDDADELLVQMALEGVYQIASFHPDYQFSGTESEDVENYTNKAPYPMLHLIREDELEQAIANYPDSDQIPARNIALLKSMGPHKVQALLQSIGIPK